MMLKKLIEVTYLRLSVIALNGFISGSPSVEACMGLIWLQLGDHYIFMEASLQRISQFQTLNIALSHMKRLR